MNDSLAGLLTLVGLLLLNAVLSAARAALRQSRHSLLAQKAEQGEPGARLAHRVAEDSTKLIATLRLAQTVCRLLVAGLAVLWLSPPVAAWFPRATNAGLYAAVGIVLVAGMIMALFGEFLPEMAVLREPERWAILLAPVVAALEWLLKPTVWVMVKATAWVSEPLTGQPASYVTEEEIKTLVDAGEEGGALDEEEKEMIYSIFDFGDTLAREVMVPRIDIVGVEADSRLADAAEAFHAAGHSRLPVYEESLDHIVGLLYAKDLLRVWQEGRQNEAVRSAMRPAFFVPETKKVDDLLAELQVRRVHMAIVIDEYGGTAGLVTLEDIVEEIFGEIQDEYDADEELPFTAMGEGEYLFDAGIDLDDVNDLLEATLPTEDDDTLGGFVYSTLGRVPAVGEELQAGGLKLKVEAVTGRRIRKIRAWRSPSNPSPAQEERN